MKVSLRLHQPSGELSNHSDEYSADPNIEFQVSRIECVVDSGSAATLSVMCGV